MIQGSPEWFAMRCGKLTASRFGKLMAKTKSGPSTSRANLITELALERLTGQPDEGYSNDAMKRGTELEPYCRAAYEAHAGVLCEEVAFVVHPDYPFVGCSPDGVVGRGLLECKAHSAQAKHLDALRTKGKSTADEYAWQGIGQMWVCGADWVDFAVYDPRFPEGLQLVVHRVFRDEAKIAELRDACILADQEITAIVLELQQLKG